jgi:hypothetical protein
MLLPLAAALVRPRSGQALTRWVLRLNDGGEEVVEVGGVDVADGDDVQDWYGGGVEGEACAGGVRMLLFLHVRSALKNRELQQHGFIHNRRFPLFDSPAA